MTVKTAGSAGLRGAGSKLGASTPSETVRLERVASDEAPEVNVTSGLAQLPADFLSASALIRPSCAVRSDDA